MGEATIWMYIQHFFMNISWRVYCLSAGLDSTKYVIIESSEYEKLLEIEKMVSRR